MKKINELKNLSSILAQKVEFNSLPLEERKRIISDEETRAKKLRDFIELNRTTRNANK